MIFFIVVGFAIVLLLFAISALPVFAAGDVSTAIENTWTTAQTQIKNVVNNVVFPAVDMILAILFFVKLSMAYMDYRKHGQFEFTRTSNPICVSCVFTYSSAVYLDDSLIKENIARFKINRTISSLIDYLRVYTKINLLSNAFKDGFVF